METKDSTQVFELQDNSEAEETESTRGRSGLKRGLKARHIQLISLAGCIGTGLFVRSGSVLATTGPAPLVIGYLILSLFIWNLMHQLSTMVTWLPIPGRSTPYAICLRYTGNKSLAFTAGFNLAYAQLLMVPAEISAGAFVISYWTDINPGVWIAIFWVVLLALNLFAVRIYGECEFWFGSIKVITLVGLIIIGVVIFFGGGPDQHGILGFHYWKDPGSFNDTYLVASNFNTARFLAVWKAVVKSAFGFLIAPELVTCCAAEAEDPRINLPKAANRYIYRLLFFYCMGSLVVSVIVSYKDTGLMDAISTGELTAAASPFVIGIQNVGIKVLNHIVNAVILTAALSSGNCFVYSSSRTLHSMAVQGDLPRILTTCNRQGVPYYCVGISALVNLLAFLTVSDTATVVFNWFSNICTISGFISWIIISTTYLRFEKAIKFHKLESRLTYNPRFNHIGAWACLVFFSVVCITNGFDVFWSFDVSDFLADYITIPIVIAIYIGHAVWTKNTLIFAPPEDIDCITGLKQIEKEEASYVTPVPRNFLERIWYWIA